MLDHQASAGGDQTGVCQPLQHSIEQSGAVGRVDEHEIEEPGGLPESSQCPVDLENLNFESLGNTAVLGIASQDPGHPCVGLHRDDPTRAPGESLEAKHPTSREEVEDARVGDCIAVFEYAKR